MIEKMKDEVAMVDRHFEVLKRVIEDQPVGIFRLAKEMGYPRHRVRYSLRLFEEAEIIEPTSRGAVTIDNVATFIDDHDDRLDDVISRLQSLPAFDELEIKG